MNIQHVNICHDMTTNHMTATHVNTQFVTAIHDDLAFKQYDDSCKLNILHRLYCIHHISTYIQDKQVTLT